MKFPLHFWQKESMNFLTSNKGLTKEHIEMLHSLKEGDRLILYKNTKRKDTDAELTLNKYVKYIKEESKE